MLNYETRIIRAAGILEGEGSFFMKKPYSAAISCEMTDKDVIFELHDLFGGNVHEPTQRVAHYKKTWRWAANGELAINIMKLVQPYMFGRRSKSIESCLNIWNNRQLEINEQQKRVNDAANAYILGGISLRNVAKEYKTNYESVRLKVLKLNTENI